MELETAAAAEPAPPYTVAWEEGESKRISPAPIIRGVVADLLAGVPTAVVSARFHRTLVDLFTRLCAALRGETNLGRVAMSGGVFQNVLLLTGLKDSLEKQGFEVFTHSLVPTNDGGIALGQAVAAAAMVADDFPALEPAEGGSDAERGDALETC